MLRFLPRDATPPKEALCALAPYEGVMARLLYARGVKTAEEAELFLHPSWEQFHDPLLLHHMEKTVQLFREAREKQIPTVVYGDYDVDGMCAASLLVLALRRFGVPAAPHIPLREEGYGLNRGAIEALAEKYRLLVTVDLGITNHEEVRYAQELGMRVIVTDHHQLSLEESPADAVVSPLLDGYPCPKLCGTGVALKVAQALLGMAAAEEYLDLAALATVADIVPLMGENRAIVALGLPMISGKKRAGIRALMEVSGISGQADSYTLGFQLAPRLNAAGRLKDANQGARLLLTQDPVQADEIARELNSLNTQRKKMESDVLLEAEAAAQEHDFTQEPALLVRGEGWHLGVIGLVAGRLCRKYACPVAAVSEENGLLHGSLRSVPGVNIHECLQACDDLLLRYGGHEQAAGVTLSAENWEAFGKRLQEAVRARAGDEAFFPRCEYDLPLDLSQAGEALVEELERLAPFGCGNPPPLFLAQNVHLARRRVCGAEGAHLQLTLRQGGHILDGIAFGMGGEAARLPEEIDAVISLKLESFRGVTAVKCEAQGLRPARGAGEKAVVQADPAEFETALLSFLECVLSQGEKAGKQHKNLEVIKVEDIPQPERGTLYVAHTQQAAAGVLKAYPQLELVWHTLDRPLCFPALLLLPRVRACGGNWRKVVLLDGEVCPGEAELWQENLKKARVLCCPSSRFAKALATSMDAGDEAYRGLYKLLRQNAFASLPQAARAAGLTECQTHAGLMAFAELSLLHYQASPFAYSLLPAIPCKLDNSPLLRAIRNLAHGKEV